MPLTSLGYSLSVLKAMSDRENNAAYFHIDISNLVTFDNRFSRSLPRVEVKSFIHGTNARASTRQVSKGATKKEVQIIQLLRENSSDVITCSDGYGNGYFSFNIDSDSASVENAIES
eukprot:13693062-Ditylum_brightwellii.AAC.1